MTGPEQCQETRQVMTGRVMTSAKRIYGLESVNRLTWITQII